MDEFSKNWLKQAAVKSGEKIEQAEAFVSIFSMNYKENPLCALQLGIAMMLDKPIALLVIAGTSVPKNLSKIAIAIEECDDAPESVGQASQRLMDKVNIYLDSKN